MASAITFLRKCFKLALASAPDVPTGRSFWQIIKTNLFNFFNLILFAVGLILLIFGRYNDAFITVSTGFVGTLVNTFQEVRAKRLLDQITLLVRPVAWVVHNGQEEQIDATQLRAGDLVHLCSGDQALVDGIVTNGTAEMDEALLTGESELIRKAVGATIFSASFCVNGDLIYQANAVGVESFAGKLTAAARTFTQISTPLQRQVTLALRLLMVLTVCMALIFVSTSFVRDLTVLQNVAASAVLVGLIPAGLFLMINLAYMLGAIKLAAAGAIVQQTSAVEALRYVDVLCMDKTGTLTTTAFQLADVQVVGSLSEVTVKGLLGDFVRSVPSANATSNAIAAGVAGDQRTPVDAVAFTSLRKWSALAFADPPVGAQVPTESHTTDPHGQGVLVLGALEMLQPYLNSDEMLASLFEQTRSLSDQGLRVLLFAHNPTLTTLHDGQGAPMLPSLQPLALISLRDELRPHTAAILEQFSKLGVQIKIISGDNPHTVAALAKQTGLGDPRVVAGAELALMNAAEFEQAAAEATVFGRIAPEQKAQLVEAIQKRGHYVAMIGDGVNDILALKEANLGIAMQSGSSATRNVADMVLINDSYAALVPALSEGKKIINGITNAVYLLLTRSLTYAFAIIGVLMVGLDFPFEPAQAGVTAITVGLPSFFLTLWARPNAKEEPLLPSLVRFVLPVALWSMLIGVTLYAFTYFHSSSLIDMATSEKILEMRNDQLLTAIELLEQYTGLSHDAADFSQLAARLDAQTTLSVFLSLSALLLILFLEPPIQLLASWRPVSPARRPALLAIMLIVLFISALYIPAVVRYLGFLPPIFVSWVQLLIGLLVWMVGLSLLWRKRWVDKLLGM